MIFFYKCYLGLQLGLSKGQMVSISPLYMWKEAGYNILMTFPTWQEFNVMCGAGYLCKAKMWILNTQVILDIEGVSTLISDCSVLNADGEL